MKLQEEGKVFVEEIVLPVQLDQGSPNLDELCIIIYLQYHKKILTYTFRPRCKEPNLMDPTMGHHFNITDNLTDCIPPFSLETQRLLTTIDFWVEGVIQNAVAFPGIFGKPFHQKLYFVRTATRQQIFCEGGRLKDKIFHSLSIELRQNFNNKKTLATEWDECNLDWYFRRRC